jgi:hypothetical protein
MAIILSEPNLTRQQLELFAPERWPKKPYCSDDKSAKWIRQLKTAIKQPYIQANPPHLRVWMIFDIDRPDGAYCWEDAILPAPTWNSIRLANGHSHTTYGIAAPVLVDSPDMRQKPLRYLCAIEAGFRDKLDADQGYSGLMTKNPIHPDWYTLIYGGPDLLLYDLDYLADWVDLRKFTPKRGRNPEEIGVGRNVALFDDLRKWSYTNIRIYRFEGLPGWNPWVAACREWALERNGDFANPLDPREVWHVVKSVSKWTWRNMTLEGWRQFVAKTHTSEIQAIRGRRNRPEAQADKGKNGGIASGVARLAASEDKRVSARLMRAQGKSLRQIAAELGVNYSTISRWISNED